MLKRELAKKLSFMAEKFPVVTLTGVRQCGKSTLLKHEFSNYRYVSLEDPDIRAVAEKDPRGFLENFAVRTIIDEAQHVPALFSYIQTKVDSIAGNGHYILSGSHNFLLMQNISQSLAGRTAVLRLTPFSLAELSNSSFFPKNLNEWLWTGGYPAIYDRQISPPDFFPSYTQTYVERDVRLLRNVEDLSLFIRFLKLCAARIGQILNISSLSNECGIAIKTAESWLSVLESSYIVFRLMPYHKNFNKRLIKSPKLYFYDTGLAVALLGITSPDQLALHYLRGELFENSVIAEFLKYFYAQGREAPISFWRDTNGNEVDLLVESEGQVYAFEIKSGATIRENFHKQLTKFQTLAGISSENAAVIYGGDTSLPYGKEKILSWKSPLVLLKNREL